MGSNHEKQLTVEPDRSGGGAAAADGPAGAAPSNRAPVSCTPVTFEVCSRHIDSLELSSRGQLKPGIEGRLQALKELAQDKDEAKQALAQIVVKDEVFSVLERGSSYFPYALQSANFFIRLSQRLETSKMPFGLTQVRSHYLLSHGPVAAHARLIDVLQEVSDIADELTVSRLDPAVDFTTNANMESWNRHAWVTRIRAKNSYVDGNTFTGWKIGTHKDPVSLRLYNKTEETKDQIGIAPIHEVWARNGHVPWDTVWRVEGQLRREALNRFSLRTLPQVLGSMNDLWRYLTDDMVRLTVPTESDETRGRWDTHPLWQQIQAVRWEGDQPLVRRIVKVSAPSDRYLGQHINSLTSSVMGRDNIDDPEQAFEKLRALGVRELEAKEQFTDRSPLEALRDSAHAKGRRYHTMCNVSVACPVDAKPDAEAVQAYRKASDGG